MEERKIKKEKGKKDSTKIETIRSRRETETCEIIIIQHQFHLYPTVVLQFSQTEILKSCHPKCGHEMTWKRSELFYLNILRMRNVEQNWIYDRFQRRQFRLRNEGLPVRTINRHWTKKNPCTRLAAAALKKEFVPTDLRFPWVHLRERHQWACTFWGNVSRSKRQQCVGFEKS